MVGAWLLATTVRLNGASEALNTPSLTLMMILPVVVPTSPGAGVPLSLPVEVLNVAHAGVELML
jgi:hypothetical protein